jgi:hypothetical protein
MKFIGYQILRFHFFISTFKPTSSILLPLFNFSFLPPFSLPLKNSPYPFYSPSFSYHVSSPLLIISFFFQPSLPLFSFVSLPPLLSPPFLIIFSPHSLQSPSPFISLYLFTPPCIDLYANSYFTLPLFHLSFNSSTISHFLLIK